MPGDSASRPPEATYAERTTRIDTWTKLLRCLTGLTALLLLGTLVAAGTWLLRSTGKASRRTATIVHADEAQPTPQVLPAEVHAEVRQALDEARTRAETYASRELGAWTRELSTRAAENFLPWYLSYVTQQELGLCALWQLILHRLNTDATTPSQVIQKRIEGELQARVLSPPVAARRLDRITRETVTVYCEEARKVISAFPSHYRVPDAEWETFTTEVSRLLKIAEAKRAIPLSLKAATPVAVFGGLVLRRGVKQVTAHIGSKIAARTALQSTARFFGPAAFVAVLVWDVADHARAVRRARPLLIGSLDDYLAEMQASLLDEIDTVLDELELEVLRSLALPGQ